MFIVYIALSIDTMATEIANSLFSTSLIVALKLAEIVNKLLLKSVAGILPFACHVGCVGNEISYEKDYVDIFSFHVLAVSRVISGISYCWSLCVSLTALPRSDYNLVIAWRTFNICRCFY